MYFRAVCLSFLLVAIPLAGIAQKTPSTTARAGQHEYYGRSFYPMPFMRMASPKQMDRSLNVLQHDLNLSNSQVSQIRQLVQSRYNRFETIREQAGPKFEELMRLLNQPNPDPTTVGKATIAFKQVHEQVRTEQANLEKDFLNVLNDSQRRMVNSIKSQAPEFVALYRLGLLAPMEAWDPKAAESE